MNRSSIFEIIIFLTFKYKVTEKWGLRIVCLNLYFDDAMIIDNRPVHLKPCCSKEEQNGGGGTFIIDLDPDQRSTHLDSFWWKSVLKLMETSTEINEFSGVFVQVSEEEGDQVSFLQRKACRCTMNYRMKEWLENVSESTNTRYVNRYKVIKQPMKCNILHNLELRRHCDQLSFNLFNFVNNLKFRIKYFWVVGRWPK